MQKIFNSPNSQISTKELLKLDSLAVNLQNENKIIEFVENIFLESVGRHASDIHFEPYEKFFRIRLRIDGILTEMLCPPLPLAARICARIKILSNLDISEKRMPQDGRFKLTLPNQPDVDFRVSSCPTIFGEKIVVRLVNSALPSLKMKELGFDKNQLSQFNRQIQKPQGMVLVTGPTGSGKTVTLYSAIEQINTGDKNILTVEDPVEIYMTGINQTNINLKAGLTFASALRAFLRQDPDIIMVGERRDLETAEIAIKAAQTGHLVLSTLHTNSAAEALTRLKNMGVPGYNLATSITLIIAQRLVRSLCPQCKIKENTIDPKILADLCAIHGNSDYYLYTHLPGGCKFCHHGYKGRLGIFELLPVTEEISNAILTGTDSIQIQELAKNSGMNNLRHAGFKKVLDAQTSLDEINRVLTD